MFVYGRDLVKGCKRIVLDYDIKVWIIYYLVDFGLEVEYIRYV